MEYSELDEIRCVSVILTARCNLDCAYCYQDDRRSGAMEWGTLRCALDVLVDSRHPRRELEFVGGEPLLEWRQIPSALDYVKSHASGSDIGFSLLTNGTLLNDEMLRYLAAQRVRTRISLDGGSTVTALRGAGTFEVLDPLIDRIRRDLPLFFREQLSVAMTLVPENVPHLADSVSYLLGKGLHEIGIVPAFGNDEGWSVGLLGVLDEQFARIYDNSLRLYGTSGSIPLALFRKTRGGTRGHRAGARCAAARGTNIAVDIDGQTFGCVTFVESVQRWGSESLRNRLEDFRLGAIETPGLSERLAGYRKAMCADAMFHNKGEAHSSYGRCSNCRFLEDCSVCPISTSHIPGNMDPQRVPDFQCAYNLISLKYRERFPNQPTILERMMRTETLPPGVQKLAQYLRL